MGKTAFAPTETSLYVTKEGTVTSADVESCENDYYSADELKAYAEEMLGAFESENQSGSSEKKAEITECTVKDGTANFSSPSRMRRNIFVSRKSIGY